MLSTNVSKLHKSIKDTLLKKVVVDKSNKMNVLFFRKIFWVCSIIYYEATSWLINLVSLML